MNKLIAIAAFAGASALSGVDAAEARLFEPQADWLHSGRLCASTRGPAALRWDALPPRSCHTQGAEAESTAGATSISFAATVILKTKTALSQAAVRRARRAAFLAGA